MSVRIVLPRNYTPTDAYLLQLDNRIRVAHLAALHFATLDREHAQIRDDNEALLVGAVRVRLAVHPSLVDGCLVVLVLRSKHANGVRTMSRGN